MTNQAVSALLPNNRLLTVTHYHVLQVPSTASLEQIRQAYYRAARRYHPDRQHVHREPREEFTARMTRATEQQEQSEGDDDQDGDIYENSFKDSKNRLNTGAATEWCPVNVDFAILQAAWECLRDEDLRQQYDAQLNAMIVRQQGQHQRERQRRANAIVLQWNDCQPQTIGGAYEVNDTEVQESLLIYDCRCGTAIEIWTQYDDDDDDTSSNHNGQQDWTSNDDLVDCPGCSLIYDCSQLLKQQGPHRSID